MSKNGILENRYIVKLLVEFPFLLPSHILMCVVRSDEVNKMRQHQGNEQNFNDKWKSCVQTFQYSLV